jgi:predicted DCC family thiol-disulfide oxidoreductase YuxK
MNSANEYRGVITTATGPESRRPFTILIDGLCPLCAREARFMARLDKGRGRLRIVDIANPAFRAEDYATTQAAVMGTIHGVREDGTLVTGMEVFRRAYAAVGWSWMLAWTGWRVLRPISDAVYRVFARNRLRWTGRCDEGTCAVTQEPRARARG